MKKIVTFDDFEDKVIQKFGIDCVDLSYIDKSAFKYSTIQKFRCIKHNVVFEKLPKLLLRHKYICSICYKENKSYNINNYNKSYLTKEQFIQQIKEKYNNRITIDETSLIMSKNKSMYINESANITAICSIHGKFITKPRSLMRSVSGCIKCAKQYAQEQMIKQGEERRKNFISDAIKIHGEQYDYSKVDITGKLKKVEIICPKHGSFFQYPSNHIYKMQGCPKCNQQQLNAERRLGVLLTEKFPDETIISQYHGFLKRQSLDYYFPEYKFGVEYQGEQHFSNINYFNDYRHSFKKRVQLDKQKYKKCKENGVKILYFTFKTKYSQINYIDKLYTNLDELFATIQELLKNKN